MQKISHGLDALAGGKAWTMATLFFGNFVNQGVVLNFNMGNDGLPFVAIESWGPVTLIQHDAKPEAK
ncbi:hypothetical protein [Herbaspirillum sp. YR522]|uniref:hypothetical protein n=1 Tax=Herbaspirillum sp. YR522 TaxID=1144342 RepID=UPI00026F90E3|nr:hypothetical protein [Herbaspirillum sp. YR522]EJN07987.1 hypothetical protein PMI40_01538 [Herbaspirillum sp. YR522]